MTSVSETHTILIIDDEPDFVESLAADLEDIGYKVIKAYSGREGLRALEGSKPDLIILDFMMPEMNGAEVLIELRAKNSKIPVILLTAAHPREMEDKAREYGATFMAKIYKYEKLQAQIQKLLLGT